MAKRRASKDTQVDPVDVAEVANPVGEDKVAQEPAPEIADEAVATAADVAAAECTESIRTLARTLRRRIDAVMAATGKRPGDLEAFILELNNIIGTEQPLVDYVGDSADVDA